MEAECRNTVVTSGKVRSGLEGEGHVRLLGRPSSYVSNAKPHGTQGQGLKVPAGRAEGPVWGPTRPPGWARRHPHSRLQPASGQGRVGPGEGGQHSRAQQAIRQVTNWKQPSRPPVTGEQASEAPASRVKPRMPGKKPRPLPDGAAGGPLPGHSCPGYGPAPSQRHAFRTLGRLPHTQSPAPRAAAPKEGLSGHKQRPGPCSHGPRVPSPSTTRGWAQAPLPEEGTS